MLNNVELMKESYFVFNCGITILEKFHLFTMNDFEKWEFSI